jgi:hypothetical protein
MRRLFRLPIAVVASVVLSSQNTAANGVARSPVNEWVTDGTVVDVA